MSLNDAVPVCLVSPIIRLDLSALQATASDRMLLIGHVIRGGYMRHPTLYHDRIIHPIEKQPTKAANQTVLQSTPLSQI